jgi:methylated-DNA-[protein]-cysteine S-methyltransferase
MFEEFMMEVIKYTIDSPIGLLKLIISNSELIGIEFADDYENTVSATHPDVKKITKELRAYFKDPEHTFNVQTKLNGTQFQLSVWKAVQSIPSGKTITYGQLAKKLKTGPRAIGQACRTNPLPVIYPCHRVVGANNDGGYAGKTNGRLLNVKQYLIAHEKKS